MLWAANWKWPRYGQGAWRQGLTSAYHEITGEALKYVQFGKPTNRTYRYAEKMLNEQAHSFGLDEISSFNMVGDNIYAGIYC